MFGWNTRRRRRVTTPTSSPIDSGTSSRTWLMTARAIPPTNNVKRPPLIGVADGVEALVDPSQCLVEDLDLSSPLFVGRLSRTAGSLRLDSRRTLAAQQAEVLVACLP